MPITKENVDAARLGSCSLKMADGRRDVLNLENSMCPRLCTAANRHRIFLSIPMGTSFSFVSPAAVPRLRRVVPEAWRATPANTFCYGHRVWRFDKLEASGDRLESAHPGGQAKNWTFG